MIRKAKFSKGQRVRIVINNVQPEYVGCIGRIALVRDADVEEPVYKVRVKGITLRLWATEDCLEEIDNSNNKN